MVTKNHEVYTKHSTKKRRTGRPCKGDEEKKGGKYLDIDIDDDTRGGMSISELSKKIQPAIRKASPHVKKAFHTAKPILKDMGKILAREGIKLGAMHLKDKSDPRYHSTIDKISEGVANKIQSGMGGPRVRHYCQQCNNMAKNKSGGVVGTAAILTALAPTLIPMAGNLLSNLMGNLMSPQKGRGNAPGDYSFNELGSRQPGGFLAQLLGIPQIISSARGRGISDLPVPNMNALQSNLFWYVRPPGLIGVTELPENAIYGTYGENENLKVWEDVNDINTYVSDAPTWEDTNTSVIPTTLTMTDVKMPESGSMASTLAEIDTEAGVSGARHREGELGGFVYGPGMSLENIYKAYKKRGHGMVGSLPHMRMGSGVLPQESIVTGEPIGITQRGRGIRKRGGSLIQGSSIATWN